MAPWDLENKPWRYVLRAEAAKAAEYAATKQRRDVVPGS